MRRCKEKPKYTRILREKIFTDIITAIGSQIFEFYDLPEGLTSYEINVALATGRCIIADLRNNTGGINKGWCCAPAYNITPLRLDGTAEKYMMTVPTDGGFEFTENDKFIMLRNSYSTINTLANAVWFAKEFANIDMTLKSLSKGARRSPAIRTMSCNVNAYTEAAKNVYNEDAEIQVIADNSEIVSAASARPDTVLNLTDPTVSDKIHFLSEYREELERRICTLHGIPFSTTAKSTQNLTDELHDMDIIAQFLNDAILTAVQADLDTGNAKCGTNIKVRYGRLIREQIEVIHKSQEMEVNDNAENGDDKETDTGSDSSGEDGT